MIICIVMRAFALFKLRSSPGISTERATTVWRYTVFDARAPDRKRQARDSRRKAPTLLTQLLAQDARIRDLRLNRHLVTQDTRAYFLLNFYFLLFILLQSNFSLKIALIPIPLIIFSFFLTLILILVIKFSESYDIIIFTNWE